MKTYNQDELVNLPSVSRNFPKKPSLEIKRDNFISTIHSIFKGDSELIFVEGDEGVGKTNLLSQFARTNSERTISLFIEPASRYAYQPEYLTLNISEQIHQVLYGDVLREEDFDNSYLQRNIQKLQKIAKNKDYFFIVDGITELPEQSENLVKFILHDLLPIGLSGFKFLITGNSNELSHFIHKSVNYKTLQIAPFSLDESKKFLHKNLKLQEHEIIEIHKMCKGLPGNLEIVERMLNSNLDVIDIKNANPENLPQFIAIEWNQFSDQLNYQEKEAIAILGISKKKLTKQELNDYSDLDNDQIEKLIKKFTFVKKSEKKETIEFISEAHRRFTSKKLSEYSENAHEKIIETLTKNVSSKASIHDLPDYLEDSERYSQLINCLTEDYFIEALNQTESLNFVHKRTEQGLKSAKFLKNIEEGFKFGLQKSIITGLLNSNIYNSEVEALLQINDYESAIALAQGARLKEDRLALLSTVIKYYNKNDLNIDDEIIEQIYLLVEQIDIVSLEKQGVQIASNIIGLDADLAINIVEKCTKTLENENAIDIAFAKLSIEAFNSQNGKSGLEDAFEKSKKKISDPSVQSFLDASSVFLEELTADKIIEKVKSLELKNRLFILRQWILNTEEKTKELAKIIEFALDQLISSTSYTPKLRDLREISTPLPYLDDELILKRLIGRVDSLIESMKSLGTSVDYVRLQITLAICELKVDEKKSSYNRVIEIYWYINEIDDLSVKTECISWLLSEFEKLDPDEEIQKNESLFTLLDEDLDLNIAKLLNSTASHYHITKGILTALAENYPKKAFEIIKLLNKQDDRDNAILDLIEKEIEKDFSRINFSIVRESLSAMWQRYLYDKAIFRIVKRLSSKKNDDFQELLFIESKIDEIIDLQLRTLSYAYLINFIIINDKDGKLSGFTDKLFSRLNHSWRAIDTKWVKINIGFRVSKILANKSIELGKKYFKKTKEIKDSSIIETDRSAIAYIGSLRVAIRAFSGLIPKKLYSDQNIKQLEVSINKIPSESERAALWTDLSMRAYSQGDKELGDKIANEYIRSILENIDSKYKYYRYQIIINSAPVLYQEHDNTTIHLIKELPLEFRQYAVSNIIDFILRKKSLDDPFNKNPNADYKLNYQEAFDIIELLSHFETDGYLFNYIVDLVNSLNSKKNKLTISRQQKADLYSKLIEIVESKLPDKNNISHEGFLIASKAYLYTLVSKNDSEWRELVEKTSKINNSADRAFVLGIIARNIKQSNKQFRGNLLENSKEEISNIPTNLDRIARYIHIANLFADQDISITKEHLQKAMKFSNESGEKNELSSKQKNIIDLAHKLDPNFASSLIDLIDDDPARIENKNTVEKRLELLNTKKILADSSGDKISAINKHKYAEAAWMNLGSLNAERLRTVNKDTYLDHFYESSNLEISKSYAILAWIIENANIKYSNTDEATKIFLPLFNYSLISAELTTHLMSENKKFDDQIRKNVKTIKEDDVVLTIRNGERQKAFDFIRNWIEENVNEYIKICDPYFGLSELKLLKIIRDEKPTSKVYVLSSQSHQKELDQIESSYNTHWNLKVSESSPPSTKIVLASLGENRSFPIHDRWIISDSGGLKLGTSINSIGMEKTSEISKMNKVEKVEKEEELDLYLQNEKFELNKKKISYISFIL